MKLKSIETTPSPNSIKLNLDAAISAKPLTLQPKDPVRDAPIVAQQLVAIAGIQSVFLMGDFITLTRKPHADWQTILSQAADLLGTSDDAKLGDHLNASSSSAEQERSTNFGQVDVAVQVFRGIPVQVRATTADGQQARVSLPDRFSQALQRAISTSKADYIQERRWNPYPAQFGDPNEVAQMVADEIANVIDDRELAQIEQAAITQSSTTPDPNSPAQTSQILLEELHHPDWKHRLKAIQHIDVTPDTFDAIVNALHDDHNPIRRWAAALLGSSARVEAVEPLSDVLHSDPSAIVRRTAGDALSDLGEPQAMSAMIRALHDSSPLVRWRAARFLNDNGDDSTLEALQQSVQQEPEFDVRVEILAAIDRIKGGGDTQLPMWMRLTQKPSE
jgi:hypothetical protein